MMGYMRVVWAGLCIRAFLVLYNGCDIDNLQIKLMLVEDLEERTDDLFNQLLQKIPDVS